MNTKSYLIIATICTSFMLFSIYSPNPSPVLAQPVPEIKIINPTTANSNFTYYIDQDITGRRFNLTAYIYNVEDLFAYQILLLINDTVLNITRAWLPTWNSEYVFYGKGSVQPTPKFRDNNGNGVIEWVLIGDSLFRGNLTFSGEGLLAIIELEIILAPPPGGKIESLLKIDNEDTYLLDQSLNRIPSTKSNGIYQYLRGEPPKPWLEVAPTTMNFGPFPPSVIGKVFTIEVYIKNLSKLLHLINANFSLIFNSSLIEIQNVTANPMWQKTKIDITKPGELKLNLEEPSLTPEGNISLVAVRFSILRQPRYPTVYKSPLNLSKISLTSPAGPISLDPSINGTITVTGLLPVPWLEVVPNIVEFGPEPYAGKQFNISVEIRGLYSIWELTYVSFAITYNSTIVRLVKVTEGPFLPSFKKTYFHYTIGINYVNITQAFLQEGPPSPSGRGVIATLTFNITRHELDVIRFPFNLIRITLLNETGALISVDSFKTMNGFCQLRGMMEISNLTLSVFPKVTEAGSNITISGLLTPIRPNIKITIYYKLKEEIIWKNLTTVLTDELGQYWFICPINQTGIYQIKAKWQGDATALPAESSIETVIFKAPEKPGQQILYTALAATALIIILIVVLFLHKRRRLK